MMMMPYLLAIMVDLSSETCPGVVIMMTYDHLTSFRSQIDKHGQQI